MNPVALLHVLLAGLLAAALACATPVGVRRTTNRAAAESLTANAISADQPSENTRQVITRRGLLPMWENDPTAALAALHQSTVQRPSADGWFALAELSFLRANRLRRACESPPKRPHWIRPLTPCESPHPYYVAAAAYAWATLFPESRTKLEFGPLDPRVQTVANIYNVAVTHALIGPDGAVSWADNPYDFHLGTLTLEIDRSSLRYADRRIERFEPTWRLAVRGMRNRYRFPGIGAPMAAKLEKTEVDDVRNARVIESLMVPVTLVFRFDDPVRSLQERVLTAHVEVHPGYGAQKTRIGEYDVPLESEPSVALAMSLEESDIWDLEIAGYLSGDVLEEGLVMMGPYQRGQIPLVLVHGTASSAARWAETLNELWADPVIRSRYQVWLFMYTTGNPILYSASLLRESLTKLVPELDPEGDDPALQRMVIAGHSQGGLLTKLQVVSPGEQLWRSIDDRPFEEMPLSAETREVLGSAVFFETLPFVERVVFISTPHRGSFLAGNPLGRFASRLAKSPIALVGASVDLARASADAVGDAVDYGLDSFGSDAAAERRIVDRLPSSVDDMDPDSKFVRFISTIPVDERVHAHSIIPVLGGPPPEGQNDGVVEYQSAHIGEAESEVVVFGSGHSVQSHPLAIRELRRILHEHLREGEAPVSP